MGREPEEADQERSISDEPMAVAVRLAGAEGGGVVMEMEVEADLVASAIEVALRETEAGEGAVEGALYVTEEVVTAERVPQAEPEQPEPESDQVTPLFCESFCRVAVTDAE